MSNNNYDPYSNEGNFYQNDSNYEPVYSNVSSYANTTDSSKALALSFLFMAFALVISGVTAITVYAMDILASSTGLTMFYVAIAAELVIVFVANSAIRRRNATLAGILFLAYSVCNGFTLSIIFYAYSADSIVMIFFATAALFGAIGAFATITKKDLTVLGTIGYMGLLGIIIVSIVLLITGNPEPALMTAIGIALFTGITAYDVQKIKVFANEGMPVSTVAIYGALNLYLDFVNLFLKLLRLFGRRD